MFPRAPKLVIFDKDGTLIDFQQMWGRWAIGFAERMSVAIGHDVRAAFAEAYGYDTATAHIDPTGRLAIASMAHMHQVAVQIVVPYGITVANAYVLVQQAWQPPDPVSEVVPLVDVFALFTAIRAKGAQIAVATADNREPTLATLAHLGVAHLVAAVACADDAGVAPKPAPDKIFAVCRALGVAPHDAIMLGDTPADMQMGHNAGVMAQIGVTSGLSQAADLRPFASYIAPTVVALWQYWP
ncbi:MAG: HAD family hydrolase [Chloroflexi bacterium]|nr:MAG: HAD family hydrolase [Chloroflexota bacterium]